MYYNIKFTIAEGKVLPIRPGALAHLVMNNTCSICPSRTSLIDIDDKAILITSHDGEETFICRNCIKQLAMFIENNKVTILSM